MIINLYPHIKEVVKHEPLTISNFLNYLQHGHWKDICEGISKEPEKKKRQLLKQSLPYVTVSGTFSKRSTAGLLEHSGFICMDFDDLYDDVDKQFNNLKSDPFTFAVCRSVSKTGLFALVKIDGKKHLEAFLALEDYYMQKYGLIVDENCKDVGRPRYVSFDPNLFVNQQAQSFKNYLPKKEVAKANKAVQFIYSGSDIDHVLKQIDERGVDLTDSDYKRMLSIGFAFQSEFGEGGRQYFHAVCSKSAKYDQAECDKRYTYIMRSQRTGITIGSFFHYAKEAGLQTFTKETIKAATIAKQVKKGGRDQEAARRQIEAAGMDADDVEKVIDQVFSGKDIKGTDSESLLGQLEIFLSLNYHMKRNEVTRMIELKGVPMEELQFNSIYIHAKKVVDEKVNFQDLSKLILSDFTENYNPLHSFFDTYRSRQDTGHIQKLADCVKTSTGFQSDGDFDPDFFHYFLKKWLVGIVASIFGDHSPLVLVLMGGQNAGKTEFFRRLMPDALRPYYAESKLDEGKDSEILMCKKILILDDEYDGKSKKDEKRLKELSSKQVFTVREPYGKASVDLRRLAVLCGTTNEDKVLNDPTGNRRIIPIQVDAIDHDKYNAVDKIGLFMEAFYLWQANCSHHLNSADIRRLNDNTRMYEAINAEYELIGTLYRLPSKDKNPIGEHAEYMTLTQVKGDIEKFSGQRLNVYALGKAMQALGYSQQVKKLNGSTQRVYKVIRVNVPRID